MSRVVISGDCSSADGDRQRPAVVAPAGDALEGARGFPGEADHLAALTHRVALVGRRLAVEAEVAVALLHQAVRLGGHERQPVGQADVERLAAAPLGEQQVGGRVGRAGRDGDRAVEPGDRAPERVVERVARWPAAATRAWG